MITSAAAFGSTGFVGNSEATAALRSYLPKVAVSDATVLITGETGTGKERIAAALHAGGPRAGQPFVAINCAAIPDALIESELFGHERGAFTGAATSYPGKFALAHGGTLFLDEIGEMSMMNQAKLLRVIENREVTPVGGTKSKAVNVRIIAATNSDLEDMVDGHAFRSDLYYRLNIARLELLPLRERPEDIGPILESLIEEQNVRCRGHVGMPDSDLLNRLLQYRWPGNVRELRNMVEALFIDPPVGRSFTVAELPPNFRRLLGGYSASIMSEREQLVSALRGTNWNKVEAARKLNWSRMTLYRKLAKYDLDADGDQNC